MRTRPPAWALASLLAACSGDADSAQLERMNGLEEELRHLNQELALLRASVQMKSSAPAELPFTYKCHPPLQPYVAPSDAAVTCRAPKPSAEGVYPQCNVVFQKELSIETKDYFEFALNITPQLYALSNYKDEQDTINGTPAFRATFEAQQTALPMKMMGALIPYKDGLFAVTCYATKASFSDYEEPFRRTISNFELKQKNQ
jgi:hypothetical protein